LPAGFLH